MNCKINNELIQSCDYCQLLDAGCGGVEEPEICNICSLLIVANQMVIHKNIAHPNL
jgi:hypothetical protein